MLQIADLTYRIAGRALFEHASVTVPAGRRAGLVGPNGTGKTTLLRLISGQIHPDDGAIDMPQRWRTAMVAQEAPGGEDSLLDTVLAADRERTALLAEAETATDPHRIAEIHTRLADIDAHAAPARAAAILAGLGFDEAAQARPCRELSGGMRMRVALAATLFLQPDLLLLDEPTNHLDLESALWLEGWLKAYPHTMLLVSHDRGLLNRVADTIVHLDGGKLNAYRGSYDQFERTRAMQRELLAAQKAKQETRRKHLQAFVDRFRYKASKAKQAQSRIKALEKMEPLPELAEERGARFDFPEPEDLPPPLMRLERAAVGYDGRPVLRDLSLRIDQDDRIALLGPNGNGKSTLSKLLAGRLEPLAGKLEAPPKLRIGYFAQHQTDELDPSLTAFEQAKRWMPGLLPEKVRAHLGRFGFPQARAETPIAGLSGGEKARLLFALMARDAPHLMLLDEPTNHLDIAHREALVQALNGYQGAVVLVTHDPDLIALTADRLWLVADGTVRPFDGDLDDYRALIAERRRQQARESAGRDGAGRAEDRPEDRKEKRRAAAEARAALAPLRKRAQQAEQLVHKLERERSELERRLADPALYDGRPDQTTELQIALHRVQTRLAEAEESWLEAQEALEAASGA
jgi:ATP-binding cassette subfamily F protein 3